MEHFAIVFRKLIVGECVYVSHSRSHSFSRSLRNMSHHQSGVAFLACESIFSNSFKLQKISSPLSKQRSLCPLTVRRGINMALLPFLPLPALNESPNESKDYPKSISRKVDFDTESNDAVAISGALKGAIQRLYSEHITLDGVDYDAMKRSDAFMSYVTAAARLPELDITSVLTNDSYKRAFFINLYNAATQHAIVARGPPPSNSLDRLFWTLRTTYTVGRYTLSLHDIENGILRRNKSVSLMPPPFGLFDNRRKLCVDVLDPRIHFVLNCAANSCPPVLFLTVENIADVLADATIGFLKNDSNFRVHNGVIYLSQIFKWYKDDFSRDGSNHALLSFVCEHGDTEQDDILQLKKLMNRSSQNINIEWLPYDWSLNTV